MKTLAQAQLYRMIEKKQGFLAPAPIGPLGTLPHSGSLRDRNAPGSSPDSRSQADSVSRLAELTARLTAPDTFLWATGIEDTFITAPWPATGRILDEYELTDHYRRWSEDLDRMADLGVQAARYGVPWHRVNPSPGEWDFSWVERPLNRLLELNINPIVDLVHYGLPGWLDHAFLNPDFPHRMAEYAGRLAERFKGQIGWYTPLNEPRITAWYSGKLGWWPPNCRGWNGFVRVLLALCRGIVETEQALRSVDPEMTVVHVDATDVYTSPDPTLQEEVKRRQEIGYLALDLVSGRVNESHSLWNWLLKNGATSADLNSFRQHPISLDIVGTNLYPMYSQKRLVRSPRGIRVQMAYGAPAILENVVESYWKRYGRPVMITETASVGSVEKRRAWLEGSLASVKTLRKRGVPVVGYTWWPMFALVAWAYRQGTQSTTHYLQQMGLWDLDSDPAGHLERIKTPLVDAYRAFCSSGSRSVGRLPQAGNVRESRVPEGRIA